MKTIILGIGNTLKGDDGVGPYIISKCKDSPFPHPLGLIHSVSPTGKRVEVELIDAGTVPENYIQKIIDSKPDNLIIIDAIDFGGKPGEVKWLNEISSENISISTHNLPPGFFINFIKQQTGTEIKIIAIQPKRIKFNTPLSEEVKESADRLIEELCTRYMQSRI